MGETAFAGVEPFTMPALAASRVGTWERDPVRGLVRCDAVMAQIFGFSEAEAAAGVPQSRIHRLVHPDDLAVLRDKPETARSGSVVVFEYRVAPSPGRMRWLLVRGSYEARQPHHQIVGGRGIIIDITESKRDGHVEDKALFAHSEDAEEGFQTIHRVSDQALALLSGIDAMEEDVPGLREAAEVVLLVLARRMAQEVPRWMMEP